MPLALMVHDSIQDLTSLLDNSSNSSSNNNKPTNLVNNKLKKDDQTLIHQSMKKTTSTNSKSLDEANPQQPPTYFRYAGQYEYSENYYYHHPSSSTSSISGTGSDQNTTALPSTNTDTTEYEIEDDDWLAEGRRNKTSVPARNNGNPLLHCLFPWIFRQQSSSSTNNNTKNLAWSVNDVDHDDHDVRSNKEDDGSASNNSNQLGEKLSQRERLALLNRLRLPVDATQQLTSMDKHGTATTATTTTKTNLLNGIPVQATSPLDQPPPSPPRSSNGPLKGILKHSDTITSSCSNGSTTGPISSSTATALLTSRSAEDKNSSKGNIAANNSRRSLFPTTYEKRTNKAVTFAPMARVVTVKSKNDMDADEKASVWWQRSDYEDFRRMGRIITKSTAVTNPGLLLANQQEHAVIDQLQQQQHQQQHQKWWHNFGHSRRGLEHVVSSDEGRQRQENVKAAIAAVLKEQARGTTDSEKLRAVSLTYTSWARDLAEAAAASDADAVARGFGEDRKSREFFLLKQFQKQQQYGPTIVPDFMQPRTKTKLQQRLLDANISRRPLQRRPLAATALSLSSSQQQPPPPHPTAILSTTTTASNSNSNNTTVVSVVEDDDDNNNDNMVVAVKDASDDNNNDDDSTSMAHQAAGFAADGKKHDMAAVLAGAAMVVN